MSHWDKSRKGIRTLWPTSSAYCGRAAWEMPKLLSSGPRSASILCLIRTRTAITRAKLLPVQERNAQELRVVGRLKRGERPEQLVKISGLGSSSLAPGSQTAAASAEG